jgi:hypothetical protein
MDLQVFPEMMMEAKKVAIRDVVVKNEPVACLLCSLSECIAFPTRTRFIPPSEELMSEHCEN